MSTIERVLKHAQAGESDLPLSVQFLVRPRDSSHAAVSLC